jgi:hypothetical protein
VTETTTTEKTAAAPVIPAALGAVVRVDPLAAQRAAHIAEAKARNAMVAQIRGQSWGMAIDSRMARAVANYCMELGLDPVRHVEVLGGRIYLKAEFYEEKAAPLILAGKVRPLPVRYINSDPRLDKIAEQTDDADLAAWAKAERVLRLRERVERNVPEEAVAIAVKTIEIPNADGTVTTIEGVNWCGGGSRKKWANINGQKQKVDADPVGDLEPAKTSETRAGRRAWKQITEVLPELAAVVAPAEARATMINETVEEESTDEVVKPRPSLTPTGDGAYAEPTPEQLTEATERRRVEEAGETRRVETEVVVTRESPIKRAPGADPYNEELPLGGDQEAAA